MTSKSAFFLFISAVPISFSVPLRAQQPASSLDQVLARLDRLESENQKLLQEIRELRQELKGAPSGPPAAAPPETGSAAPLPERVDVLERRSEEVDQTKVQSSQRFPLTVTGMALFNVFANGKNGGGQQDPLTASTASGPRDTGATLRQTVVGLRYEGPASFAGGKVSGEVNLDLWGGDSTSLNHLLRLRTATIRIDWANTTVSVGQDKPLISPRDPDSLAQVAFAPLTGAGNPWLWQPQARVEQRFSFTDTSGVRLQGSIYQTKESLTNLPADYQTSTQASRPGWEGRVEYWKKWGAAQKLEIASGFHSSFSKVEDTTIASDALSFDWLVDPLPRWELTGAFYRGQNLGTIGGGSGITLFPNGMLTGIHQTSGWVQNSFRLTPRLKLNGFAGEQSDRPSDLLNAALRSNLAWGGNLMYHIAPNVITSIEAMQVRTKYMNTGLRINDHYDLAIAYLF
jgi:hypothetical protein